MAAKSDGNVSYMGLLVNAGSRYDGPHPGLAHFVEHTLFKGTPSLRSWQVSSRMETVGGELNAYTTKEEIMLYTTAPAGYEARAAQLLADLAQNASFPAEEIERERGVVLEEIDSYKDQPAFAVFDDFDERFFAGSDLAHNILGYPDTVNAITREDAHNFLKDWFTPGNMVVYSLSPLEPEKQIRLLEKYFSAFEGRKREYDAKPVMIMPEFHDVDDNNRHQANTLLGCRTMSMRDSKRHALYLLNSILGGPAMNSRLNRELRERRGLVYTVETACALYSDCGVFQVYFGCDPKNVGKCTATVRRELEKLADKTLSDRAFNKAVEQLCGQLLVSGDNMESRAMLMAKSVLRYGEVADTRTQADKIRSVTPAQLRDLAIELASRPWSSLSLI